MREPDDFLSETTKSIGTTIGFLLPLVQFAFQWLPSRVTNLFVNKDIFFYISLITLILSLLVYLAYLNHPYFQIATNKEKQRKYNDYLKQLGSANSKSEPPLPQVEQPYYINQDNAYIFIIPFIFFLSVIFLQLGLNFKSPSIVPPYIVVAQSVCYMLIFVSTVYLLVNLSYTSYQRKIHDNNIKIRARRAISLAIENNAITNMPMVSFINCNQVMTFPLQLQTIIKVGKKYFRIITDDRGEVLNTVNELNPPSKAQDTVS